MISYLKGTLRRLDGEPPVAVLVVGGVGYDVQLPMFVRQSLLKMGVQEGSELELEIYFHQTERQPKPLLVGFCTPSERAFFERIISVEGIGPAKAAVALNIPPQVVIEAIENEDAHTLALMPGIGARAAQKMIASLKGKLSVLDMVDMDASIEPAVTQEAIEALINLQYRPSEARRAVEKALRSNPEVGQSTETILKEVFRHQAQQAVEGH